MYETIEIHESPQCKEAVHSQTEGGFFSPPQMSRFEIKISQSQNKRYYFFTEEQIQIFKKLHKKGYTYRKLAKIFDNKIHFTTIYRILKRGIKTKPILYCQNCGNIISWTNTTGGSKPKCCFRCRKYGYRKMLQERNYRWRNPDVERKSLINNCIICGQNISMYHGNAKYCMHCSESDKLNDLGTVRFSSHMRRKYDHTIHKVVPDYEKERKAIDGQMKVCGLK